MKKWARLFCCGSKSIPVNDERNVPSRQPVPVLTRNTNNTESNRVTTEAHSSRADHHSVKPKKKNLAVVRSQHKKEDLIYAEIRPENNKEIKYDCPICFRYFNKILVSDCCKNYYCHFCVEDLNHRATTNTRLTGARCSFCDVEGFELSDVNPKEKVKRYTDSPCSTFQSKNGEPIFMNTLKDKFVSTQNIPKMPQNEASSPEKSEYNPRGYASDGFVMMKREFESSLRNPVIHNDDENVELPEMSRTAELGNRKSRFFLSPDANGFRSASEGIRQASVERGTSEISEESFNDREEIAVIEEVNESIARESMYQSPDHRQ